MTEIEENRGRKLGTSRLILMVIAATITGNVFRGLGGLNDIEGMLIGYFLVFVIDYWIPPRPPVGFFSWVVRVSAVMAGISVGLWLIPRWLDQFLWTPLAYGIPTLLMLFALNWAPPLYIPQKQDSTKNWLLFSFVFALIYGAVMYFAK